MSNDLDFSDLPIKDPKQDALGILPFVRSLARSIRNMDSPQGVVLAINGPWGSGKSSAINLLQNELAPVQGVKVVSFNPWWFRGKRRWYLPFSESFMRPPNRLLAIELRRPCPNLAVDC